MILFLQGVMVGVILMWIVGTLILLLCDNHYGV